jgi:hypothetical protein
MLRSIGLPEIFVLAIVAVVIFKGSNFVRGGTLGIFLGAFVGFLMRPSVPMVGQLPFRVVLERGTNLTGFDTVLRSTAEQSFNYMLIGAIIGAIGLGVLAESGHTGKKVVAAAPSSPMSPNVGSDSPVNQFCTKCGKPFAPDVQFCGICGNRR